MSGPASATASPALPARSKAFFDCKLDVNKLHAMPSEQQSLYILNFTADFHQHIVALNKEDLLSQQSQLTTELLKLLRLSSPPHTRVLRNNIGRCFVSILSNGSRTALFDITSELIGLLTAGNKEASLETKLATVVVLGYIFEAVGDDIVSHANPACHSLLKLFKNASQHTGLRASIFTTIAKIVSGVRHGVDEQTAKDVWKRARDTAVNDKSFKVQEATCVCLEALLLGTPYFCNHNEFEHLKSTIWKVIESPNSNVRHAAATCLASTLVQAYKAGLESEPAQAPPKKLKNMLKRQSTIKDEDQASSRPQTPSTPGRKQEISLTLSLSDALRQLSTQYCKPATGSRSRAGIAVCYQLFLKGIGEKTVETTYPQIASHFIFVLQNNPTITYSRYRLLLTRKFVKSILEDTVGKDILHESSQLDAAKWLVNSVIKDYPQAVPERPEPSKHSLTVALSALDSLIQSLGSAMSALADTCREALLQVSQHPSYTVQIYTAHCLRSFVIACPQQLLVCVTICLNSLTREVGQLSTPRHSARRCLGLAHALAAMLSTSRLQPLYGSVEIYAQVFNKATRLLKESSTSELRSASTQIQVAFILIGGLMPLGPSFTKIHLSQLFKIWRNALCMPAPQDTRRGPLDMSFLAHVRECALTSILAFLEFNDNSLTSDGAKHIAKMLHNTAVFLDGLPKLKPTDDISQRLMPSLQLKDFVTMVRRRLLQCFARLIVLDHGNQWDILSTSNFLGLAVTCFVDPDISAANSLDSSIAGSATRFESLWNLEDNFGFGVTGLTHEFSMQSLHVSKHDNVSPFKTSSDCRGHEIDCALTSPICQGREHDPVQLYISKDGEEGSIPDPPATGVVNAAIQLFSVSLPLQPPKIQESIVEQIAALLSAHSLNRNLGRKAAMVVNTAVALLFSLRMASSQTGSSPGRFNNPAAQKIIQELLLSFIKNPDPIVREIAAEALGRMCNSAGNVFTNNQISSLVDVIIDNRDPNVRAGCALALGCIHSQVGAMSASFHLKTIVGVLMSLCNDMHPIVHFWALEGLVRVADAAGPTFSTYVFGCLGMLARLYISDSHNDMAAPLMSSNMENSYPTTVIIGHCVGSLINVMGPDLRDTSKARDLILTLVKEFQLEQSQALVAESAICMDNLALYAREHLDFKSYVQWLQKGLKSPAPTVRGSIISGLSNLMKSEATLVIQAASPTFEDDLWLALDDFPNDKSLRGIILDWLQQTGLTETKLWVQRLQAVWAKTRQREDNNVKPPPAPEPAENPDEEVAGFASAGAIGDKNTAADAQAAAAEPLKWQTRNFVMVCLSELLTMVSKEMVSDETIPSEQALQDSVGDVIKMAFSASTYSIIELRVWGLKIIDQTLRMFGKAPDPDFTEASLLEQYQAQIGSALTPAFAQDSSPELASGAINVCATFVSAGIVTNVDKMGRIFRILVTGLENFATNPDISEIGDFKGLNSNARVMVKLALFSAWARLQIMSNEQPYLVDIVKPYSAMLTPLWLSSLEEYARLRFEPEISTLGTGPFSDNLDDVYAALNRETLLKFYQDSWLYFVDVIASLVEKDSDFVFDALDRKGDTSNTDKDAQTQLAGTEVGKPNRINYRDEPVAFFFVLYGLIFEALMDQNTPSSQKGDILQALRKLWHPSVTGNAIYQDAVFTETMDTLDRLVLTEGMNIQGIIVGIARNLSLRHPSATGIDTSADNFSEDIEQLFELTRTIIFVLSGLIPNLSELSHGSRFAATEEASNLTQSSMSALVDVVSVFPSIIRADLSACVLHIFMAVFTIGPCQTEVVPRSLPTFRHLLQGMMRVTNTQEPSDLELVSQQMRGCLKKLLSVLAIAQRRESEYSLPCAKNVLLGMTIVLSCGGSIIPPQDELIIHVLDQYLECLEDVGLANVAAGCLRTLLMGNNPRSPTDDVIGRYLFPRLLAFISSLPLSRQREPLNDPENSKPAITQALISYITSSAMTAETAGAAMTLVIPALLRRARNEGGKSYDEISSRLLEIAAAHQSLFRPFVATMPSQLSSLLEEILRSRVAKTEEQRNELQEQSKPSITLRMDF